MGATRHLAYRHLAPLGRVIKTGTVRREGDHADEYFIQAGEEGQALTSLYRERRREDD